MARIYCCRLEITDQQMKPIAHKICIALVSSWMAACKPVPVTHWFPVTPQEHYEKELYKDKLERTTAGQTWFRVAREVLKDSVFSSAPYQERFYLGDSVPAQAVRLLVPEGRRLVITPLRAAQDSVSKLFVELYRIKTNGKTQRRDYLSANGEALTYDNHELDTLLLRLQTGLNESLVVTLTLTTLPSMGFPVSGRSMSDVISTWGADRDGGIRLHEGIDIRAKRGTPVVAAQSGFVTQTGTNNLGGKVVFVSAMQSPYSLYYAHLDSQMVSSGQRVVRGDTLGMVGNTGNAITTAPHLHFGIYSRGSGAVNPLPFINDNQEKTPGLPKQSEWLGDTAITRKKADIYLSAQFRSSERIGSLPPQTTVRILGESAKGYRVQLNDGTKGYIPTIPLSKFQKTGSEISKAED
jgi:murein DD-endopeptidase MepM/ murein hydrolase activator NlpD